MDLSDRKELVWLSKLVRDVCAAVPAFRPLLVGAMARDLLLHYAHAVPIVRATEDVDLAFAVADWGEFEALRTALIDSHAFAPTGPEHRLLYADHLPVDLIPFGGVEARDGSFTWPRDETEMGVLGYREAHETAVELVLPASQRISTVSLPMLAVLKLLAWSERHSAAPRKDATDLFLVLRNYLTEENSARLYQQAAHLLEADDFDYEAAGGWLAGHDAASQIIACSPAPARLFDKCEQVLSSETDPDGGLDLVAESHVDVTAGLHLLQMFFNGFRAGRDHHSIPPADSHGPGEWANRHVRTES